MNKVTLGLSLGLAILTGCAGISNPLGGGGVTGQSALNLTCPDGKSTATYSSGLLPQTSPVTVSCTTGNPPSTSSISVTGSDLNAIIAAFKAGVMAQRPATEQK